MSFAMLRFLGAYAAFVLPLLRSLFRESFEVDPRREMVGQFTSSPIFAALVWYGTTVATFLALRFTPPFLAQSGWIKLKHNVRTTAETFEDLLKLIMVSTLVGVGACVFQRMSTENVNSFPLLFVYYLTLYCILFESTEALTKLTLTAELFRNPFGLGIVFVSGAIILWFVLHHVVLMSGEEGHPDNFWFGCLAVLLHFSLLGLAVGGGFTKTLRMHIHHWFWPLPLALMCVYLESTVSGIACAMFCAISYHGAGLFGYAPIFYNKP